MWLSAAVVVNFDVDKGNSVELCFPEARFSERECHDISFLAMPESYGVAAVGDVSFSFTFQREAAAPTARGYSFGFAYFRRIRDASIRRGFAQRSVVLVTDFPIHDLFSKLARRVGRLFFEFGPAVLEQTFHTLNAWSGGAVGSPARADAPTPAPLIAPPPRRPPPRARAELVLPFLGQVVRFSVPPDVRAVCAPEPGARSRRATDADAAMLRTTHAVRARARARGHALGADS